jgi:hypothetical protein
MLATAAFNLPSARARVVDAQSTTSRLTKQHSHHRVLGAHHTTRQG